MENLHHNEIHMKKYMLWTAKKGLTSVPDFILDDEIYKSHGIDTFGDTWFIDRKGNTVLIDEPIGARFLQD